MSKGRKPKGFLRKCSLGDERGKVVWSDLTSVTIEKRGKEPDQGRGPFELKSRHVQKTPKVGIFARKERSSRVIKRGGASEKKIPL